MSRLLVKSLTTFLILCQHFILKLSYILFIIFLITLNCFSLISHRYVWKTLYCIFSTFCLNKIILLTLSKKSQHRVNIYKIKNTTYMHHGKSNTYLVSLRILNNKVHTIHNKYTHHSASTLTYYYYLYSDWNERSSTGRLDT